MQNKEVRNWQDEEALKRFQIISPLLDESLDEGRKSSLGMRSPNGTGYRRGASTDMRRLSGKDLSRV